MHTDRITYLLQQYLDNSLTPDEAEEWGRLLQGDRSGQIRQALEARICQEQDLPDYQEADWDPLFQKIRTAARPVKRMRRNWLMAAAALVILSLAVWLITESRHASQLLAASTPAKQTPPHDIIPGSNKATLTLADNTSISLDDAKDGVLGRQGNTQLIKRKDGQLSYQTAAGYKLRATDGPVYNLLTTPRGGQYQLVLPDGSKVWLNAASRLKYPTSFSGKERVVELQGEAYFEIAHNPAMPFKVSLSPAKGTMPAQVEVLGTHFNIKAYPDEPAIHTTLLEGSVKVHKGNAASLLRPGQQARWSDNTDITVMTADVEEVIAWKNGLFKFDEATIGDVMRQLARWYDVEVEYVNGVPRDLFQGEIYRNVNVSKVLKVLEASGVHFTVEGKKILVRA
jgi:ferric-dicitrate binding protein FerR (iron transport regulator)